MAIRTLADVAETLRSIRKDAQRSQAEMASAAGLSRVTVARLETQATKDMSLQSVLSLLDGAGYELQAVPKKQGMARPARQVATPKASEAVRRYLARLPSQRNESPLKLEFAYDWSNQHMPEETLIRKVLEKGRFHDVAVICKTYGLDRVRQLAGDKIVSSPSLRRTFANIEEGFARAQAKHPA